MVLMHWYSTMQGRSRDAVEPIGDGSPPCTCGWSPVSDYSVLLFDHNILMSDHNILMSDDIHVR